MSVLVPSTAKASIVQTQTRATPGASNVNSNLFGSVAQDPRRLGSSLIVQQDMALKPSDKVTPVALSERRQPHLEAQLSP